MNWFRNNKIKTFIVLGVLVLGGVYGVQKFLYKPHTTTEAMEVAFTGSAKDLLNALKQNGAAWHNKAVVVTGKVTGLDAQGLTVEGQIYAQFTDVLSLQPVNEGQYITVKARVIGYDDLLEELKLDKTIIIKN